MYEPNRWYPPMRFATLRTFTHVYVNIAKNPALDLRGAQTFARSRNTRVRKSIPSRRKVAKFGREETSYK